MPVADIVYSLSTMDKRPFPWCPIFNGSAVILKNCGNNYSVDTGEEGKEWRDNFRLGIEPGTQSFPSSPVLTE